MMDRYKLNDAGEPERCDDLIEWASAYEKSDRNVARTHLEGGVMVSTVFLAIDHGWPEVYDERVYRPVLYETMVFGGEHDGATERYCTKSEALEGHDFMVKMVEGRLLPAPALKLIVGGLDGE